MRVTFRAMPPASSAPSVDGGDGPSDISIDTDWLSLILTQIISLFVIIPGIMKGKLSTRLLFTSVTSTPGALRPQISCLREVDMSCMQVSASVRWPCFSSTHNFEPPHLFLLRRKSRNEG